MAILNRCSAILLYCDSAHCLASGCGISGDFQARDSGNRAIRDSRFCATNQERKISPKSKFLGRISRGHPGVIRADIPAQNFGQGAQNLGKTSIWARDIHDPKARTSTTLTDFQKLRSEKPWAEFSLPN